MEEAVSARAIVTGIQRVRLLDDEIEQAAGRKDRLSYYRMRDLRVRVLRDVERAAVAHVRLLHEQTPTFTGEAPDYDGPSAA